MTNGTELCRLTLSTPRRRIDVALPDRPALAELLPDLLRHAGSGLADDGQAHGGWVLRRCDGRSLSTADSLAAQGIRDGDVLHLVPARTTWPDLAYDDVVDAIAAYARSRGRDWDGAATRVAALVAAGVAVLLGIALLAREPEPLAVAAAATITLVLAAGVASRAYGQVLVGIVLAAYAVPYAFLAGLHAVSAPAAARLLVAFAAMVAAGALGGTAVGRPDPVPIAVVGLGAVGLLGAGLGALLPADRAAAVLLALLSTGLAAVPLLATRLGRLPVPALAGEPTGPPGDRVAGAVDRADRLLTGLLIACAGGALGAAVVLAHAPGWAAVLLALAASGAFALRARSFAAVHHRIPLLLGGCAAVPTLLGPLWTVWAGARAGAPVALLGLALFLAVAAVLYHRRPPGPYLARAADLADALCVVSVLPLAAQVLGLYGRLRGLIA